MYKKKITKKELNHLKAMGINSFNMKRVFQEQKIMRKSNRHDPCYECKTIAIKLGYET